MSDTRQPGGPPEAREDAADRALREGLRAPGLTPEALQRIRRATEAEWRAQVAPAPRRWLPLAAAAALALVALAAVLGVYLRDQAGLSGEVLGTVARLSSPGMHEHQWLSPDIELTAGSELRVSQELDVRGDVLIQLAGGGNLRVARVSTFQVTAPNAVRLERGELYVDIPPGARGSDQFTVTTPRGEFRHVGTQFSVAVVRDETRLRVREGAVRWLGEQGGDALVERGNELTINRDGSQRRAIATAGRDWAWAESLAPELDIEDRPLKEFLEWFSRQTGRTLVLADDATRQQVDAIRMHGNIRGLGAMEALAAVMASTTLRYELPEGMIRVSSARDSRTTS